MPRGTISYVSWAVGIPVHPIPTYGIVHMEPYFRKGLYGHVEYYKWGVYIALLLRRLTAGRPPTSPNRSPRCSSVSRAIQSADVRSTHPRALTNAPIIAQMVGMAALFPTRKLTLRMYKLITTHRLQPPAFDASDRVILFDNAAIDTFTLRKPIWLHVNSFQFPRYGQKSIITDFDIRRTFEFGFPIQRRRFRRNQIF